MKKRGCFSPPMGLIGLGILSDVVDMPNLSSPLELLETEMRDRASRDVMDAIEARWPAAAAAVVAIVTVECFLNAAWWWWCCRRRQ